MATDSAPAGDDPKRSAVEGIKEKSRWLRGTIADELANPDSDHLGEEDKQLLKFHGSYQQEDRDARKTRSKAGVGGKHYMFMVRLKLPGGKMTGKQYLALDDIAGEYGNGTLRLTTRQSIQFHGDRQEGPAAGHPGDERRPDLHPRGVRGRQPQRHRLPVPAERRARGRLNQQLADAIAKHLAPRSNAYHDVWLNGETDQPGRGPGRRGRADLREGVPAAEVQDGVRPAARQLRGRVRQRPRLPGRDRERPGGRVQRPRRRRAWAEPVRQQDHVPAAGQAARASSSPTRWWRPREAVVKFFRDHGNRADRKRARLKYVISD